MNTELSFFTSPHLRGEVDAPKRSDGTSGEGEFPRGRSIDSPPHPARSFSARHPLPARGERDEEKAAA